MCGIIIFTFAEHVAYMGAMCHTKCRSKILKTKTNLRLNRRTDRENTERQTDGYG